MSEMKRAARNRAARHEPDGAKAQPVSEMERAARNRAARHEPDGAKAQPVSEMERGARNRAARRKISANYLTVYLLYTLTCVYEKIGTRVSEKNIRWEVPA